MVLFGLRDDKLPEPAWSGGHAEKAEFMAEGAGAGQHSCGWESHMRSTWVLRATANTLKELHLEQVAV
jgi:hypothetical protein